MNLSNPCKNVITIIEPTTKVINIASIEPPREVINLASVEPPTEVINIASAEPPREVIHEETVMRSSGRHQNTRPSSEIQIVPNSRYVIKVNPISWGRGSHRMHPPTLTEHSVHKKHNKSVHLL